MILFNGDENSFRAWAGLAHVPTWQEEMDAWRIDVDRRLGNLEGR